MSGIAGISIVSAYIVIVVIEHRITNTFHADAGILVLSLWFIISTLFIIQPLNFRKNV